MQNARVTCKRFLSLPLRLAALTAAVRLFGRAGTDEGTMDLNDNDAGGFKFGGASDGMRACSRRAGSPRLRLCRGSLRSERSRSPSSAIASVSYAPSLPDIPSVSDDGITGTVSVNFKDGSQVDYENISPLKFLEFVSAPSVGAFYNSEVRSNWG
jgi:hypothetical protein